MSLKNSIPISDKFNLTIEEAAKYFSIGENKLREMIKEADCDFVLYVGRKALIKRMKLEVALNKVTYI